MAGLLRIAVISTEPSPLASQLAALPSRPAVQTHASLYGSIHALRRFAPEVLFLAEDELEQTDIGAVQLLRQLLPRVALVVVAPRARELQATRFADLVGAQVLAAPFSRDDVAQALTLSLRGQQRPALETLLDFSHGISDEINNPLLFALGHLQLLMQGLDAATQSDTLDRLQAVRAGLWRIEAAMDKIRLLHRAFAQRLARSPLRLGALMQDAIEQVRQATSREVSLAVPPELTDQQVEGDAPLLQAALAQLVLVALAMGEGGAATEISMATAQGEVVVRVQLDASRLPEWQLPRTFDPYYVNRILRGTPHGLSLFLVQCIAQAHDGRAVARRRADGKVLLDVALPLYQPSERGRPAEGG